VRPWKLDLLAGDLGGAGQADGVGSDARFCMPASAVSDGKGKLYVADACAAAIRQIEIATGAVTTLAGGYEGYFDGIGAEARFKFPTGLALDGKGSLFIGDSGNHVIRKLNLATGRVGTVAGKAGTSGAVDSAQGHGVATFYGPMGLVFDDSDNLYVADSFNGIVRVISISGGLWVTTLRDATNAPFQFIDPETLAYDGAKGLYVADEANHISKITLGSPPTLSSLTYATGDVALFKLGATSVALDGSGVVYVGEGQDPFSGPSSVVGAAVSLPSGSSTISTLVGDCTGVCDVTYGGDNTLFVLEESTVVAVPTTGPSGPVTTLAGRAANRGSTDGLARVARFSMPTSIVYDGRAAAYVLDSNNQSVRKLNLATGKVTTVVATHALLAHASALTGDGNGSLYAIAYDRLPQWNSIRRIAIATGEVSTLIAGGPGGPGPFSSLAADASGNLYAGNQNSIVRIAVASGIFATVAGKLGVPGKTDSKDGQALFGSLQALAWDGANTLYVADDSAIRRVAISDGSTTTLAGVADMADYRDGVGDGARFAQPVSLAFDPDGILYVVDTVVRRVDIRTRTVTTWIGTPGARVVRPGPLPAEVNTIAGIAFIGHGELLLTDAYENAILHVH
jgi:streptogramin lyase